jgi:hypothetical protein
VALLATTLLSSTVLTGGPVAAESAGHRDDDTIVGADGVVYPRSPTVVRGRDGDLFDGYTFDVICADGGQRLSQSITRLAKVATLIRTSGRRVVFSVMPPKALVNESHVIRGRLPHGKCDRLGLDQQRRVLDTYRDRDFLNVRPQLAKDPRQVYWRTDPHWTTVGASIYTKQLAKRLDPAIGARQRYQAGPDQSGVGAMTAAQGDDTPETVPSLVPRTTVEVTPLPGTPELGSATYIAEHEWRSSPARLTYPGRTLVIGDSFGLMALANLRPVLRRGHFMWADNPYRKLAAGIRKADTVVIEIAHLFVGVTPLGTKAFRTAVRKALA